MKSRGRNPHVGVWVPMIDTLFSLIGAVILITAGQRDSGNHAPVTPAAVEKRLTSLEHLTTEAQQRIDRLKEECKAVGALSSEHHPDPVAGTLAQKGNPR